MQAQHSPPWAALTRPKTTVPKQIQCETSARLSLHFSRLSLDVMTKRELG